MIKFVEKLKEKTTVAEFLEPIAALKHYCELEDPFCTKDGIKNRLCIIDAELRKNGSYHLKYDLTRCMKELIILGKSIDDEEIILASAYYSRIGIDDMFEGTPYCETSIFNPENKVVKLLKAEQTFEENVYDEPAQFIDCVKQLNDSKEWFEDGNRRVSLAVNEDMGYADDCLYEALYNIDKERYETRVHYIDCNKGTVISCFEEAHIDEVVDSLKTMSYKDAISLVNIFDYIDNDDDFEEILKTGKSSKNLLETVVIDQYPVKNEVLTFTKEDFLKS